MTIIAFDHEQAFYANLVRGLPNGVYYSPYMPAFRTRLSGAPERDDSFIDISDSRYEAVAGLPDRDLVAILDSGVTESHPLLRPRIVEFKDFTGEGSDDTSGHGTMRALQSLIKQPTARFIVAKVVGTHPCKRETLIDAINWAVEQGAGVLYLALGEYNLFCRGGCKICRAAKKAIHSHRVVIAAPGNRRNRVACPAKARGVTRTTSNGILQSLYALINKADLSTIPGYFEYRGEGVKDVLPDILDFLDLSEWRQFIRHELDSYRNDYRVAHLANNKLLPEIRQNIMSFLQNPLMQQMVVLDEIWEGLPEGMLDGLGGGDLDLVFPSSMWVPIGVMPKDFDFYATVPYDAPELARYLMTRWEYVWANMARILGRGYQYETFRQKIASQLETYLSNNPSDADALYQLGTLHLMAEDKRQLCREPLLRAYEIQPEWPQLIAAMDSARCDDLI